MTRLLRTSYLLWAVAVILALVSAWGFWWTDSLPFSHDGPNHLFRLYALDQEIRGGDWYPTRFPSLGLGYGFAILDYYPPLVLYLMEAFRLLGAGYLVSFKLGCTLIAIIAASTSFWFGVNLQDPWMGLVTAFVYVFSPYLVFDLYERGAISEYAALAFVPLVFLALHKAVLKPGLRNLLFVSGSGALLIFAHFLSVVLLLPFLLLYTLLLIWRTHRWRPAMFVRLTAAAALALSISAFYWLPASFVRGGIRVPDVQQALSFYTSRFLPLSQIFKMQFWVNLSGDTATVHLANLPLLMLLLGAVAVGIDRLRRGKAKDQALFGGFGLGLLLSVGLATIPYVPLYTTVPFLSVLQFPFRWLGPASFCLAVLIGGAAANVLASSRFGRLGSLLVVLLLVAFGLSAFPNLPPTRLATLGAMGVTEIHEEHISEKGIVAYERDAINQLHLSPLPWALEYVPEHSALKDVEMLAGLVLQEAPVTVDLLPVAAYLQPLAVTRNRLVARSEADVPWTLSLHAFFVPGWQATVDGIPATVRPVSQLGLVGVDVPEGNHEVALWYGWTWQRRLAAVISVLATGVWILGTLREQPSWGIGLVVICITFSLSVLVQQSQTPSPPLIQTTAVDFNRYLTLTGYGLKISERTVLMDLVWLTRRSTPVAYKTFVHVVDDTGKLWEQADTHPLSFASRMNRWIPGQVVVDQHRFALPVNLPSGRYQIRIGVYNEQNGVRLPILNAAGQEIDDQVLLDYIEVLN